MYKILAIVLLVFFVSTATVISINIFYFLQTQGMSEQLMWATALVLFILAIPAAIKAGDALEWLWRYA